MDDAINTTDDEAEPGFNGTGNFKSDIHDEEAARLVRQSGI